ncbi:hypothetical protein [Spirosoma jeollabukense]
MKKLLVFFVLGWAGLACQHPDSANPTPAELAHRSILIYSTNFPGGFEVTDYDATGIPTRARTAIDYTMDVIPAGRYTSTILLSYDDQLRIKKTVQTYDQRGIASCCPNSVVHDPDQQIINEYDYWKNTTSLTHEVSYSVNAKKAETRIISESFRTYTDQGQLVQEKRGNKVVYEAAYDANGNVISETQSSIDDPSSFTRRWRYDYDASKRMLSRRIVDATGFENNSYDEQGRLVRQVSNLFLITPFKPQPDAIGRFIDYASFSRSQERYTMSFSYLNGQFWSDAPRVVTYAYEEDQTLISCTTYALVNNLAGLDQPGFDFAQIPKENLLWIRQTTWRLNKANKLLEETSSYTYQSDKVTDANRDATYAFGNSYSYDASGNLVGQKGYSISSSTMARTDFSGPVARYKTF